MPVQGTFWWNELSTTDVEGAKIFYAEVVGWKTDPMPMEDGGTYWMLKKGDEAARGLMAIPEMAAPGTPPYWMAYVAVDDVDAEAAKVEKNGGPVMVAPFDIPGIGRTCVIKDPQGAVLSLITSAMKD